MSNQQGKRDSTLKRIVEGVFVAVIAGLLLAGILALFNPNPIIPPIATPTRQVLLATPAPTLRTAELTTTPLVILATEYPIQSPTPEQSVVSPLQPTYIPYPTIPPPTPTVIPEQPTVQLVRPTPRPLATLTDVNGCPPAKHLDDGSNVELVLVPNIWYHLNISRNVPSSLAANDPKFETNLFFQLAPGVKGAKISFDGSVEQYEGKVTTNNCGLCTHATGNWRANVALPGIFDFALPCGAKNENDYPEIINYIEWDDGSGTHRWP